MLQIPVDPGKRLDVVAVGSWTNVDHLFRVERLPAPGDTVRIVGPIEAVETTFWGGCAPNNAATAARLGAKAALVSVVGRDFRERGYQAHLSHLGVDLRGTIVLEDDLSGHSFLFSDPSGAAICLSHLGAAERQEEFDPPRELLADAKVVVVNYRFDQFGLRSAQAAAEAGACVIVSGSLSTAPDLVRPMVEATDVLICTAHEMGQLLLDLGLSARADLFALGIKALVETRGKEGSTVQTPDDEVQVPAVPARVVDPVGAGDAFVGGVAAGLAFGQSLVEAARLGAAVASFVVEASGCQTNLPTYPQAVERLGHPG